MKNKFFFILCCIILILLPVLISAEISNVEFPIINLNIYIPSDKGIHSVEFSFTFSGAAQDPVFSVQTDDDDSTLYLINYDNLGNDESMEIPGDGTSILTKSAFNEGYRLTLSNSGNTYTFKLEKKPTVGARGTITSSSPQITLHIMNLSGMYSLTEPSGLSCRDSSNGLINAPVPEVTFDYVSMYENIQNIRIQTHTGSSTVITDDQAAAVMTTDNGDEKNFYTNAYDISDNYLGPILSVWSAAGDFDNDDYLNGNFHLYSSVIFDPDNAGTGTITSSFRPDRRTTIFSAPDINVTAAGPLHHIKIVDSSDPPVEINSPQVQIGGEFELFAGGYDVNGYYRKLESVDWSYTPAPIPVSDSILSETSGTSTKIIPTCVSGLQEIIVTADHAAAVNDSTGTIEITAGVGTKIDIRSDNDGLELTTSYPLNTGNIMLYAFSTDDCGNPTGILDADWEITDQYFTGGTTASLSSTNGTSVTFTPPGGNRAGWADVKISDGGMLETTVTLIILADAPSQPSGIRINTLDAPQGPLVENLVIETSALPLNLFATGWDQYGNYTGTVDVLWETPLLDTDHSLTSGDDTAVFDHGQKPGLSLIKISKSGVEDYTGDITVIAAQSSLDFDVVQVLDHSGSMGGFSYPDSAAPTKMDAVKEAAQYFVNLIEDDSQKSYGLVIFDHQIDQLIPQIPGADIPLLTAALKSEILDGIISDIEKRGATSIGGGLLKGMDILDTGNSSNQSILLLTDGKHNSPPGIDNFIAAYNNPVAHDFPIHIIALGYDVGVNGILLRALLDELDGTVDDVISRGSFKLIENSEDLPLSVFKAFNQVLVQAGSSVTDNDPFYEIRRGDPPVEIPVEILPDQGSAAFSVFWQGAKNALEVELKAPDGTIYNKYTISNRIRYGAQTNYKFFEILFPLSSRTDENHEGRWTFIISAADNLPADKVIKMTSTVSTFRGIKFEGEVSRSTIYTGDTVNITGRLSRGGKPLSGVSVTVECDMPESSAANMLMIPKYDGYEKLTPIPEDGSDITALDNKISNIEESSGPLVRRKTVYLQLYDDGKHGDEEANDGIYSNNFALTTVPGCYNLRLIASDIPAGSGKTTSREFTTSFFNVVNVYSGGSDFSMQILSNTFDGNNYKVVFTPKDKYGNYLGPGFPLSVSPKSSNSENYFEKPMVDNLNGTYTAKLFLTPQQMLSYPKLIVELDDGRIERSSSVLDTGLVFPEKVIPTHYQGQSALHIGTMIPISPTTAYIPGISGIFDFGYSFTPEITLLGIIDYHYLFPLMSGDPHFHFLDICLDLKYALDLAEGDFKAYAIGGGGIYFPEFNSFDYGINGGLGFEKRLSEHVLIDLRVRTHYLAALQEVYLQASAGILCKFQLIY